MKTIFPLEEKLSLLPAHPLIDYNHTKEMLCKYTQ